MALKKTTTSKTNSTGTVTAFLDGLNHPLRKEIDQVRRIIQSARPELEETVKWNGPNFNCGGADRITMRIHPPTQIQLVFHRGAAVQGSQRARRCCEACERAAAAASVS